MIGGLIRIWPPPLLRSTCDDWLGGALVLGFSRMDLC
jgi:hypothetical protein